jgi:hypothetical protein
MRNVRRQFFEQQNAHLRGPAQLRTARHDAAVAAPLNAKSRFATQ